MSRKTASPFLEANLSALLPLVHEELVGVLRTTPPAEGLETVETKSGCPTWRAGGRWVYSRHDPVIEARRIIEREVPKSTDVCVFENFGLGYHVEAFLALLPRARAIVVEPDIGWFRSALEARDLTAVLASARVTFLLASPAEMLHPIVGDASSLQVVRIRALAEKDRDYFRSVSEELQSVSARRDVNKNTLARFGKRWVRNLIRNIHLIPRSGGVGSLRGGFAGIPAIVLAAGPSLDEVLPHLRELRERFLLIAVDTSYRAALEAGVAPDFLVVVDPQYWNARHLDGYDLDASLLVSESSTYPSVFHRRVGGLYFCGSLFPLGQYLEQQFGEKGVLGAGGSVSTTTWDFARLLGCSPLYCAGLDLGFPSLKTHFRGALFEERMHTLSRRTNAAETQAFHLLRDAGPYPIRNNSGDFTLTDRRLVVYKWWFETQLRMYPDAVTYNLAAKGVRIEGMPFVEIEKLLADPPRRGEIDRRVAEAKRFVAAGTAADDGEAKLEDAIGRLLFELRALKGAAEEGASAVEELDDAFETNRDAHDILLRLETVDQAISQRSSRDIVGFLIHSTAQDIIDRKDREEPQGVDRRQALHDSRELYGRLREAAEYHIELLSRAANRRENAPNPNEKG